MAMYRITKFIASDMDKAGEIAASMRDLLEDIGVDLHAGMVNA